MAPKLYFIKLIKNLKGHCPHVLNGGYFDYIEIGTHDIHCLTKVFAQLLSHYIIKNTIIHDLFIANTLNLYK